MNETIREMLKQALKLDEDGRRLLAQALIDSVTCQSDDAVTETDWAIIEARLRDMEENPDDWVSWDDLRAELLDEASDAA